MGVLPHGLITFVSNGFGGKTSDKAFVEQSHVLYELCSFEDEVMIDRGFNNDDMCGKHGLGVVQPPFLRNVTQFSLEEANSENCQGTGPCREGYSANEWTRQHRGGIVT